MATMFARKIVVSSFALILGLGLAGRAAAAPETPATADAANPAAKACCKHHDDADGKAGMHCDHAKMKAEGEAGKACCAQHAAMHEKGAADDAKACCARHAEMMKDGAATAAKACCAEHAAMKKDGAKGDCCCCGGGACPHHAPEEAPAKS